MNRLKEMRKEIKKTQKELGKELNISASAYGKYEREERSVPAEIFRILAKYYHESIEYLMGDEDERRESCEGEK